MTSQSSQAIYNSLLGICSLWTILFESDVNKTFVQRCKPKLAKIDKERLGIKRWRIKHFLKQPYTTCSC